MCSPSRPVLSLAFCWSAVCWLIHAQKLPAEEFQQSIWEKKKSKIQRNKRLINLNHKHTHTQRICSHKMKTCAFAPVKMNRVCRFQHLALHLYWLHIKDLCTKIQLWTYYLGENCQGKRTVSDKGENSPQKMMLHRLLLCNDGNLKKSQSAIQLNWVTPVQARKKQNTDWWENLLLEKNSICLQNLHLMRYINFLTVALSLIIISKIPF